MSDIIQSVFDVSFELLDKNPKHVQINDNNIQALVEKMKADGKPEFFGEKPEIKDGAYLSGTYIEIIKELIASSINYCYWYSTPDCRINNVSSTKMYEDVESIFEGVENQTLNLKNRIRELVELLSYHRFPLIEERKRHLFELMEGNKAEVFAAMVHDKALSPNELFDMMIKMFQGFSSDTFLKRASLFFIQLYRKFGWYEDDLMTTLHVPADYQVPKILRHFNCITYSDKLAKKIDDMVLIKKHSLEETQIRAATIVACTKLQYSTGWTIADVDTYLWTKRKLTDKPFHMTITTDY